jgi:hypothetical protein
MLPGECRRVSRLSKSSGFLVATLEFCANRLALPKRLPLITYRRLRRFSDNSVNRRTR